MKILIDIELILHDLKLNVKPAHDLRFQNFKRFIREHLAYEINSLEYDLEANSGLLVALLENRYKFFGYSEQRVRALQEKCIIKGVDILQERIDSDFIDLRA